jgi:predicted dehydrogenase
MAKSGKIGWGVIGSTSWSDHTFAPAIQQARGAELRAVLASSRKKADAFCARHGVANGYHKLADFVADKSIDAVWIGSPTFMHKEQAIAALKAGKHVLCEKPMAISPTDCRAMMRAAKAARRKLHVGYNTRHHPKLKQVRDQFVAGRFGKPVHGRVHLYYPYPVKLDDWHGRDKKAGSWILNDIGTHLIDQLLWFLGDAKKVEAAHLSNPSWGMGSADHAALMISFRNGAVGSLTASTGLAPGAARLEFYADNGYVIIDNGLLGMEGAMTTGLKGGKARSVKLPPVPTYRRQVEVFGNHISSRAPFPLTAEEGLENVKLISQARGW